MSKLGFDRPVAVIGAGIMGTGIAQVAAAAGHPVLFYARRPEALQKSIGQIAKALEGLVAKGKMTAERRAEILARLQPCTSLSELGSAALVVESIAEDIELKRKLFAELASIVAEDCILSTNTSALSIAAIARGIKAPGRVVGMHFFNPAPLMALVEVVSAVTTDAKVAEIVFDTAASWGKTPVHAKNTPGFIVNRCARPYYTEAWRLLGENGLAPATLDAIMREAGGFRMGPCELMDLIGHDVNFAVTSAIHAAYFGDARYRPSLLQQELVDAGRLGRKSGRGFYDHSPGAEVPKAGGLLGGPKPVRLVVHGRMGLAEPLIERARAASIEVVRENPNGSGALVIDGALLRLTDGRTATRRARDEGSSLVLFDLAFDYAKTTRLAIAAPEQSDRNALIRAAGFFEAIGITPTPVKDLPGLVVMRTVAMLINEAMDAAHAGVAEAAAIDVAMMKGVNYPRGPFAWAEALGLPRAATVLENLREIYGEDRYRVSLRLQQQADADTTFSM